jgi:hypothetical protein
VTGRLSAPARVAGQLLLSAIVLAGTAAAGSLLFAIAMGGSQTLPHLVGHVGVPGAIAVIVPTLIAVAAGWRGLPRAVLLGFLAGAVATGALEAVRESGFRVFDSMPGDLPMLMGVLLTGRIMDGPDGWSNLAGWGYHVWNGAMFAIVYAIVLGGAPRGRRRAWAAALLGAGYGLALGTGFLLSPVPVGLGVGHFGTEFGARFAVTVYLAHAAFGASLGLIVHRFGRNLDPIWTPAWQLARTWLRRSRALEGA